MQKEIRLQKGTMCTHEISNTLLEDLTLQQLQIYSICIFHIEAYAMFGVAQHRRNT
jgi:hypothetical protein